MNMKKGLPTAPALAVLIVLSLYPSHASAQDERAMPADLRALVEAERAFSRESEAKGMKDAFLAFAADDGVLFRRTVVNAKELWRNTNPAPTSLLTWRPSFADISRAGDMGYDFGPWEFRTNPSDKDAAAHGHFITVWRKQRDGSWKFEVDIGVGHPAPPAGAGAVVEYPTGDAKAKRATKSSVDLDASRASLLEAERQLSKDAAAKGAHEALLAHADEQVRLFMPDAFPLVGKGAGRAALKSRRAHVTWRADKAGASSSGDLGYTYGTYETRETASDAKPSGQGHYVRIWKRADGGRWRVVLGVINPVRPPAR